MFARWLGDPHYWKHTEISPDVWATLRKDAARVIARYKQLQPDRELEGPTVDRKPELSEARIWLTYTDVFGEDPGPEPFRDTTGDEDQIA